MGSEELETEMDYSFEKVGQQGEEKEGMESRGVIPSWMEACFNGKKLSKSAEKTRERIIDRARTRRS